jgi:hypothetical protein
MPDMAIDNPEWARLLKALTAATDHIGRRRTTLLAARPTTEPTRRPTRSWSTCAVASANEPPTEPRGSCSARTPLLRCNRCTRSMHSRAFHGAGQRGYR